MRIVSASALGSLTLGSLTLLMLAAPSARGQAAEPAPLTRAIPAVPFFQQRATPDARFARLPAPGGADVLLMWAPRADGRAAYTLVVRPDGQTPGPITTGTFAADTAGVFATAADVALHAGSDTRLTFTVDPDSGHVRYALDPGALPAGAVLPDLALGLMDGTATQTAILRGRVLVFNTWYIGCAGCMVEMPELDSLAARYAGRDDVAFLALSPNEPSAVRTFLRKHRFGYTQARENAQTIALFQTEEGYPRNVIVDANGVVVYNHAGGGETTASQLAAVIDALLPPR